MFSKINRFALVALILSLSVLSTNAATIDPLLQTKLGTISGDLIPAVVTYNLSRTRLTSPPCGCSAFATAWP